jgi:hypothetical protein
MKFMTGGRTGARARQPDAVERMNWMRFRPFDGGNMQGRRDKYNEKNRDSLSRQCSFCAWSILQSPNLA